MSSQPKTLTPKQLFLGFSRIGMSGFGGVLPWARRMLVEQEKWLTTEEFSAMLGICQIVPGPNIVNLGVCVGSRFAGVRGAFAAVMGLMLGPVTIVILLGILYEHYSYMPIVQGLLVSNGTWNAAFFRLPNLIGLGSSTTLAAFL